MATITFHQRCHRVFDSSKCKFFTIMADDYFALVRHQVWCLDVFDGYPVEFDIILEREPGQQPEYTYSFTFCIPENTYTEWCKSRPVEFAQLRQFDIDHERKDKPCLHK